MDQLKKKRILHKDDEAGRLALEKIGYVFRSRSKKGHQIMVLGKGVSRAEGTANGINASLGLERQEAKMTNQLCLPQSPDELVERLGLLHREREEFPRPPRRLSLTNEQRVAVLDKTDGRCHLCGGEITEGNF